MKSPVIPEATSLPNSKNSDIIITYVADFSGFGLSLKTIATTSSSRPRKSKRYYNRLLAKD
jgi:hypothetical protein